MKKISGVRGYQSDDNKVLALMLEDGSYGYYLLADGFSIVENTFFTTSERRLSEVFHKFIRNLTDEIIRSK